MLFERRFTTAGQCPYNGIAFVPRHAKYTRGKQQEITVPEGWSQVACDIMGEKYMRKAGVPISLPAKSSESGVPVWLCPTPAAGPKIPTAGETDARQVFDRLAGFWAYWGWKLGYFKAGTSDYRTHHSDSPTWKAAEESARAFYDEIRYMLSRQMAAPASPQWFNAGLHWAYGIGGDDCGQWAIDFSSEAAGDGMYVSEPGVHVTKSPNPYKRPALSACFIQSVKDNLVEAGGIHDLMRREALVFKYGGGSGSNWSPIRGEGEPLSGGGVSSGLISFLKAPDYSAGAIKSGGTTRRAARMLCLNDDHPELMAFVAWKPGEEKKVAAMAAGSKIVAREVKRIYEAARDYRDAPNDDANPQTIDARKRLKRRRRQALGMGVPKAMVDAATIAGDSGDPMPHVPDLQPDFEGAAYETVCGQNANNSIRVTNKFMAKAVSGEQVQPNWNLYGRVELQKAKAEGREPKPHTTINASDALDKMAYAAWECGCPGWQYDSTINEWWTCPNDGPVNASNPCSEYMAADDTACNLASLNLMLFLIASGVFDIVGYEHAARIWTVVLDITVSAAGYPSEEIARGSMNYRTLGLGYANFGALMMRQGIPYNSDAARAWCGYLTALLQYRAAHTSAELASELGAFPRYQANYHDVQRVMRNHANYGASWGDVGRYEKLTLAPTPLRHMPGAEAVPANLRGRVERMADVMPDKVTTCGMRNAQLSLLAPTGTIGLLMDCDTTGIEPDFALVKFKKLAGGGYFKIINQSVPHAMKALGYTDDEAEKVRRWVVGTGEVPGPLAEMMRRQSVPEQVAAKIAAAAPNVMKLADAVAPWVVGKEEYDRVGLPAYDAQGKPNGAAYLAKFGVADVVRDWSYEACGHLTVEGCPIVKPEHLPVFDCANRCGFDGKRFLSVASHLHMMAAAQPVLSGAISKTVNFPEDATPGDFRDAAIEAWKLSLKAMAGYRDGSKMSQPLNIGSDEADEEAAEPGEVAAPLLFGHDPAKVVAVVAPPLARGTRSKLPNRVKSGDRVKLAIVGASGRHKFYLRCGNYPNGELGEIFIDCNKEGATLRAMMNAFAKSVSIGLQFGVPLAVLTEAFVGSKFEPNGPIQGHDRLRRCDSIIDAIFRELAIQYLGQNELAHVTPEPEPAPEVVVNVQLPKVSEYAAKMDKAIADANLLRFDHGLSPDKVGETSPANYASALQMESRAKGYSGNQCPNKLCKAFTLVRAGNCFKCDSCGEQSGCV